MSNLIPAESLIPSLAARPSFDLAAPNPILGKTVFLRLPASAEWSYDVDEASLHAKRNLILRDQMWVTEGEAGFVAIHKNGGRVQARVEVRPWKSRTATSSVDGTAPSARTTAAAPPDERLQSRPVLSRLHLTRPAERGLRIRCHHTQRQIELRWKTSRAVDIEPLLTSLQCH